MFECVLSQFKALEFYILSCEKGFGLRPRPFSQLRMWSSSGFILYLPLSPVITTIALLYPRSQNIRGAKCVLKHQHLQMFYSN